MKARTILLAVSAMSASLALSAETWKNAPVIDGQCVEKVKANPDKHTVKCALACADEGYGILAADGTYLKFDAAGNAKALAALQATKKTDHLRADVEGERSGEEIKVTGFKLL
ncbi:MAG: hypothetical protein WAU32_00015 [Thermoanaerobaculia bacterium]|jgi:hypothetical protein